MREAYKFYRTSLWLIFFVLIPSLLFAQAKRTLTAVPSTIIDTWVHGYYISLPAGYSTSGKHYPLLVFFHGEGQVGDGSASQLPVVLQAGPPMQLDKQVNHNVDAHFPDPVVVGGKSYEFIVMAPQLTQQPDQNGLEQVMVNDVINYAISHYRVDTAKMSVTGLSMGGGIATEYAGQSAVLYGRRLATLLGCAIASFDAPDRAKEIAAAHLPVWLTVNSGDQGCYTYTLGYIHNLDSLQASPPPTLTIFNAAGHYGWLQTYGAPGIPGVKDTTGLNVYQWMAQYRRTGDSVVMDQGPPTDTVPRTDTVPTDTVPPKTTPPPTNPPPTTPPPVPPTPPPTTPPPAPPPPPPTMPPSTPPETPPPTSPPPTTPPETPPPAPPTPPAVPIPPVTWGPYAAQLNGAAVTVSWSTLQEQDNKYFIVQRSVDEQSFADLDTIAAANVPHSYSYVDEEPLTGTSYYRLMEVALDGSTSKSYVMSVSAYDAGQQSLNLRPNPSSGRVYLELMNAEQGTLEVNIADASGKPLRKWSFEKRTLGWQQAIDTGDLPAGTYFITVKGTKTRQVRSFLRSQD